MFKTPKLVALFLVVHISVRDALAKPQDFIPKQAENWAKPSDAFLPLKNRAYEAATGKQDSQRREEGIKKLKFILRNWRNESWDQISTKFDKLPKIWEKGGPVKVVVHGWTDQEWEPGKKKEHMKTLNNQVLDISHAYQNKNTSVNMVILDWIALATENAARYDYIVGNVKIVGEFLAEFLVRLHEKEVEKPKRIHIIGYGMGSHVAGVAGHLFEKATGKKVGRISGLDPVGPGFEDPDKHDWKDYDAVMSEDDAIFVDSYHCTGATTNIFLAQAKGKYGSDLQSGHADFFPNGGEEQPGCKKMNEYRSERACSMKKCVQYFLDSIEGVEYLGCPCPNVDDWKAGKCKCDLGKDGQLMGEPCSHKARGKYYVKLPDDNMGLLTKFV